MSSPPRRHHYISRFLMRGFSEAPDAKNPPIWRLDKKTGRPNRGSVDSDAVVRDFYKLKAVPGVEPTKIEKDLAMIEGIAAGHLERLLTGAELGKVDRSELATYLMLQHRRTPRGRQWFVEMYEHMSKLIMEVNVNRIDNTDGIREFLAREGHDASDEAVEAFRRDVIDSWREGRVVVEATTDHEVLGIFTSGNHIAASIPSQRTWELVWAEASHKFYCGRSPIS